VYEELSGAEGRQIFYRAERFDAARLFSGSVPQVEINRDGYRLNDLSIGGLAVIAGRTAELTCGVGEQVPIRLRLGNTVLHEGSGRICRIDPTPLGEKVALHLTDSYFDIPHIVAQSKEASLRRELDGRLGMGPGVVDPAYRQYCIDVLHLLRRYRFALEKFGATANEPGDKANGADTTDILAMCEEHILPQCRDLWRRGNELVRPLMGNPDALDATKRFTELIITPEFLAGPIWQRCYEKPLGYPGDFQVMNYAYSGRREGDTPYAKLLHGIGQDEMESIATRMMTMQQIIAQTVAERPGDEPVRITSLASGPAQEIVNYLRLRSLPRPAHFTLVDQDCHALSSAYHQTYPEVVRLKGSARVECLHASFSQLLRTNHLFKRIGTQDLIYAVGLLDYLGERTARLLLSSLYKRLAPGGRLVIANVTDGRNAFLWPAEFVCDWSLIYRNRDDMRRLTDGIDSPEIKITEDPNGKVYFLHIKKA
jgi:hypothetical protein